MGRPSTRETFRRTQRNSLFFHQVASPHVCDIEIALAETEFRVPDAGSFIRPDRKTDGERAFLDALKDKYATHHEYEQLTLESSGKKIEMVGFDKVESQQR
jgi:hypothetical protein